MADLISADRKKPNEPEPQDPVGWLPYFRNLSLPVRVSLLLQAASLPTLLLAGAWPWVMGWLLLNHTILSIAGTVPRSKLLGPNQTRILSGDRVALTFDDGPDPEVTPAVLEILEQHGVKATFFLIGERAEQHSELVQRLVQDGHSVENHTHRHSWWFWAYTPRRLALECAGAQRAIERSGAGKPTRFRAPAGVRSPWLQPILKQLGLQLTSWSRRGFDTSQQDPSRVLSRLTRDLKAGEILLLHDGNAARTEAGQPMVLAVLDPLLSELERLQLKPGPLPPAHQTSS